MTNINMYRFQWSAVLTFCFLNRVRELAIVLSFLSTNGVEGYIGKMLNIILWFLQ